MKHLYKILLLVAISFGALELSATEVSKRSAEAVAKRFMSSANVTCVEGSSGLKTKGGGGEAPVYYLFTDTDSEQWVIVSADNCLVPILAHGKGKVNLDNMPVQMMEFLNVVKRDVEDIRKNGVLPSQSVKDQWNNSGLMVSDSQKVLNTAQWNQGAPYNQYCPVVNGKSTYAGCLATAMAIFIRYCEWPAMGKGVIPGYVTRTKKVVIPTTDISTYTYNYDNMPLTGADEWSSYQKAEVASLMSHCGKMVEMDYDVASSGAASNAVLPAMVKHLSYSGLAQLKERSHYSNQEWLEMIKHEIDSDFPIIYCGFDDGYNTGHSFICDGYNSYNEIHINWGWSGTWNGWFSICYLGVDRNFFCGNGNLAFFGLRPNVTGEEYDIVDELFFTISSSTSGITLQGGNIAKDASFTIGIWNLYDKVYTGSLRMALYGMDGAFKEFISPEFASPLVRVGSTTAPYNVVCKISTEPAFGDYICLCYKQSDGSWLPVGGDRSYNNGVFSHDKMNVMDEDIILLPDNLLVGQLYYPSMAFGHTPPSLVTWYFDGNPFDKYKEYVKLTSGVHTLKAVLKYADGGFKVVERSFEVKW